MDDKDPFVIATPWRCTKDAVLGIIGGADIGETPGCEQEVHCQERYQTGLGFLAIFPPFEV